MERSNWKELITVDGMIEAEIIKAKLCSNEIPVYLQFESAGHIFGITMNGLGKVKILVPDEQWQKAFDLISENPEN